MRPIPVSFHIGPLVVHTYGIGLAVTFAFGYWYYQRRLRAHGYPTEWLSGAFVWIIVAAIVGARAVHVVANWSFYSANPAQIPQVWQGGLSSFGGLALGVPTGLWLKRRHCPQLRTWRALDLITPVLMACWSLGRLLGPQLMVRGGGRPTTAWFGMYYAGQAGKRIPAPLFQSVECLAILLVLFWVERRFSDGPQGMVVAAAAALWGLDRFADEVLYLAVPRVWDAVEVTGLVMSAAGLAAMGLLLVRRRSRARLPQASPRPEPAVAPPS
ncbi:MAG TPA: prolipoprotein diacylglyceryl transferase family protein [Acidimicrobiales bacterium]|nr:prolipoprotein diacylglyceryl transferase family protein [Acidimicrobiales bacterium]